MEQTNKPKWHWEIKTREANCFWKIVFPGSMFLLSSLKLIIAAVVTFSKVSNVSWTDTQIVRNSLSPGDSRGLLFRCEMEFSDGRIFKVNVFPTQPSPPPLSLLLYKTLRIFFYEMTKLRKPRRTYIRTCIHIHSMMKQSTLLRAVKTYKWEI